MAPGVLWVSSRIANPSSTASNALTPDKFCDWYENQHIYEVTELPGVPRAARYEAVSPQPDPDGWSAEAPWLTVYEMPDIEYRNTAEFRGLDGQSRPKEELLKGVFEQARFDTRFYEEVQASEKEACEKGPAKFLVSWAAQPAEDRQTDFDAWYEDEIIPAMMQIPGFRRVRRYRVINATTLDCFVRREEPVAQCLALCEFDGEQWPQTQLSGLIQAERERNPGLMSEIGWYGLKRKYDEK